MGLCMDSYICPVVAVLSRSAMLRLFSDCFAGDSRADVVLLSTYKKYVYFARCLVRRVVFFEDLIRTWHDFTLRCSVQTTRRFSARVVPASMGPGHPPHGTADSHGIYTVTGFKMELGGYKVDATRFKWTLPGRVQNGINATAEINSRNRAVSPSSNPAR